MKISPLNQTPLGKWAIIRVSSPIPVMRQAFPRRPDARSANSSNGVVDRLLIIRRCATRADQ
jgi:hypothetical protein